MADERVTRRLTAIVAVDVAGYSRLVATDEEGTLVTLRQHRADLIEPAIGAYQGRIANTAGDSFLVEFPSVVNALRCAIELQHGMAERNSDIASDRRITFRIGINLGDVVEQDGDLLGDGINVAARLESLAEPGGICISNAACEQVRGRVEVDFEDLGAQALKNIPEPVRVYRVLLKGAGTGTSKRTSYPSSLRLLKWTASALIVALAFGAVFLWWQPWAPNIDPASFERMAFPLPDKPSIAVLPFANMSNDSAQEYFADGMTEDLITDLSKLSGLFVIARNSVFAYKGRTVPIRQVAEELGVRYVLEGSVRRSGETVRISAQLIDATTAGHLWAERYDGRLDDVFSLQDRVSRKIASVLAVELTTAEAAATASRETTNPRAYDVFLKGWDRYLRQTPEDLRAAIAHFEESTAIDPTYARAYAALAATYWQIHKRYWHGQFGFRTVHGARFKAEEYLAKAERQPTALSHQVAANMLSQQGRHTAAIAEAGRAVGVDPNDADSYVALAGVLNLAGKPEDALQLLHKAMRLNPHFPSSYLYELGLAQFGLGDFPAAAVTLEKATTGNPDDRWSLRLLLATYGHLGRDADAQRVFEIAEKKNYRGADPISIRGIAYWYPFKRADDLERLTTGLRKANVPD